eukprot:5990693-Pleurochrysis_carterae.AAC.1
MPAFAMSQAAGKRDPLFRAMHAEISSKSAAREKLEPLGLCLRRLSSRTLSIGENTVGLRRSTVTIVGALASRIDVSMNQRVGRELRRRRNGSRRRRSACVRWKDERG